MNKTEIIHVRVSEGTKNALSALAEKEGCTMSTVIESLIEEAAKKSRNNPAAAGSPAQKLHALGI